MNAIILAAGLGSRFKEVTKKNHKALLLIDGKPNLERTIEYLLDANIEEIKIVVGYLSDSFKYLESKYKEVELIYNEKYSVYNNLYSFTKVLQYFSNSFVIDADIVLKKNVFDIKGTHSRYLTTLRNEVGEEWLPIVDENFRVKDIEISIEKNFSLSGISYWDKNDCKIIKEEFSKYMSFEVYEDESIYWDNVPMGIISTLNVYEERLENNIIFEMDTVENYYYIQEQF